MLLGISLIIVQGLNPVMASIFVPGLGQMINGERAKAQTFFVVEGAIWLSYIGFNYWGDRLDASARAFAVEHAGANPGRSDDEYFDAVEDYLTSADYNLYVERYASLYYPDNPELQQEYIEMNSYVGDDEWAWDSLTSRSSYWDKRRQSREHRRRASFMPGFAIINRIISVVDVLIFAQTDRFGFDTSEGKIGLYYKF
ncbi:MAG: hypothetical protein JSU64_04200 [candidate division WOR-3 bacterium]|nr:MAG: hypothetical protein JSU64_04200 [candidate division WOR-3 bacterium]